MVLQLHPRIIKILQLSIIIYLSSNGQLLKESRIILAFTATEPLGITWEFS